MGNCSSSRSKHSFKGLLLERVLHNPQTSENKKTRKPDHTGTISAFAS